MRQLFGRTGPMLFAVLLLGACTAAITRRGPSTAIRGTAPGRPRATPARSNHASNNAPNPPKTVGAKPNTSILVVADRLYWTGKGGNLALRIATKFNGRRARSKALALDQVVGRYHGRSWTLADVLISVDLNANGTTASWVVSGPGPLIGAYAVRWAQRHKKRVGVYCGQVTQIPVVTSGHLESDEP